MFFIVEGLTTRNATCMPVNSSNFTRELSEMQNRDHSVDTPEPESAFE